MLENNREEEDLKKHLRNQVNSIKVPKGLKEEMWTRVKTEPKKKKLNPKVLLPYLATLACCAILVALGLSEFPFNSDPAPSENITNQDEKNIQTIEEVLQKTLNGPSDELRTIMETQGIKESVKYDERLFKDYFANRTSYLDFVNNYGTTVMIEPLRNNYQLKVNNIEYEKSESKEIIYDFTVELQYQKVGSESSKVEMVTGEVNLNKEHKIEAMEIRISDFLGSLGN